MIRGQNRLRATLALTGSIVGAGIFGVPAMIGAWGIPLATLGFVVVTGMILAVHLLFAEAVLGYQPDARITGFARHWLGPGAAAVVGVVFALEVFGTNLAYLILGGEFFAAIAEMGGVHLPVIVWQVAFWAAGACIVLLGLRWMSRIQVFLTWILVALLLLMVGCFIGRAHVGVAFATIPTLTFEPYGIFLYSLLGFTVIPELELLVKGNRDDMRKAVWRGTLLSAGLTYIFGVTAWLAGAGMLGRDAVSLLQLLPPWLGIVVPVAGLLAVVTSYVTTAFDLGALFHLDYHFPPWVAATVGLGVPLLLLFLTRRDFLATIGLVGSVFAATVAVFLLFMGRAALIARHGHARHFSARWWWQEVTPMVVSVCLGLGGITWLLV